MQDGGSIPPAARESLRRRGDRLFRAGLWGAGAITLLGVVVASAVLITRLVDGGVEQYEGMGVSNPTWMLVENSVLALLNAVGVALMFVLAAWFSRRSLRRISESGDATTARITAGPYWALIPQNGSPEENTVTLADFLLERVANIIPTRQVAFVYEYDGKTYEHRVNQLFGDEEPLCDEEGTAVLVVDPNWPAVRAWIVTRPVVEDADAGHDGPAPPI